MPRHHRDAPEKGMYGDAAYRPAPHELPRYIDVPTCPACGQPAAVPAKSYRCDTRGLTVDHRTLFCSGCGWVFIGTPEQAEQAQRAEEAWNARTDGRKGPWTMALRCRHRKVDPRQERMFR